VIVLDLSDKHSKNFGAHCSGEQREDSKYRYTVNSGSWAGMVQAIERIKNLKYGKPNYPGVADCWVTVGHKG